MSLLRYLGLSGNSGSETESSARTRSTSSSSGDTQTVRRIMSSLDAMEPDRARFVAAFAYILCRVARTDLEISAEEAEAMERIVMERGGLDEQQAIVILQIAKTQESLFGSTENYLVTREFNKLATREQKLALIDCLFAVSAADESISTTEDNEIVRIASELQLPRDEVTAARGRYREYLAVLKGMPAR
jgi:uncharacterized tellurite resistance protein B-like protein